MPKEFQRENRYVVFKRSDMRKYLSQSERRQVEGLALHICLSREDDGKQPLNCLVIEKDWPEYEPTWKSIEARVTGTQPAPNAVAYLDLGVGGYMDVGTDLTDEELATLPKGRHMLGVIGTYGVDGYVPAQPAQSVPDATWFPVPDKHPTFDPVDLQLADGSVLCGCVPQSDGDYWWEGPSGEVFIDPRYAPVTHWRLAVAPNQEKNNGSI